MKLSDIKQSKEILFHLLGIQKEGKHKCCFHEDSNPSMVVRYHSNVWHWKCFSGCGSGTAIDAAMKVYNVSTCAEALRAIEKEMGIIVIRDEEYQEPIINQDKAEQFINYAYRNLISNFALREYYSQKRKIFKMSTIINNRIGFVEKHKFPEWRSWEITGWVLPVTNSRGEVKAVKIHQEKRLRTQPKCVWAPFGTYPEPNFKLGIKAINGLQTFWPHPEKYLNKDFLIITAGELKALALVDAGYQATAPTAGENKLPERMLKRIEALNFKKIFINYDEDSAGKDFKDLLIKGFSALGILAIPFTYGSGMTEILTKNEPVKEPEVELNQNSDMEDLNKEWVIKNLEERIKKSLIDGSVPDDVEKFTNQLSIEDKKSWFRNQKK